MRCKSCGCELDLDRGQGDDVEDPECFACAHGIRVCCNYSCIYYDSWSNLDKCHECTRNEIGRKAKDNFKPKKSL